MADGIKDATLLWQALRQAGLSTRTKSGRAGYDAALVADIREVLFPGSPRSLERDLKKAGTSAQQFLEAFFRAAQPFAMMLSDILAMFEDANAKRSDNNLKIVFQLGKASPELAMSLQAFRETTGAVRRLTHFVRRRQWTIYTLYELDHAAGQCLEEFGLKQPEITGRRGEETSIISGTPAEQWCRRNGRRRWVRFPGFTKPSNEELSAAVLECESLLHAVVDACMEAGPTYDDLSPKLIWGREMPEAPDEGEAENAFWRFAHDHLENRLAAIVEAIIHHVETLPTAEGKERSRRAAKLLADIVNKVPVVHGVEEKLERSFHDLINLPVWKRRYEVYAVWVGARIMRALPDHPAEWHPDGDTLCFPFSGVHLATLKSGQGDVQFWTEKRTSLNGATGVFGRKSIQPDFRLMFVPVDRRNATALVVECKQYKRGVSSWFAGALDDYALGCPEATVLLVNYGEVAEGVSERVHESRRSRCHVVAKMRPDNASALAAFKKIVQASIPVPVPAVTPAVALQRRIGTPRKVVAKWEGPQTDVDLYLVVSDSGRKTTAYVNYASQGDDQAFPWARLVRDVRSPPGGETITFGRPPEATYDLFVDIYEGENGKAPGSISVEFEGSDGAIVLEWPVSRPGRCWYVCWFDDDGTVHAVNRVYDELPPQATGVEEG